MAEMVELMAEARDATGKAAMKKIRNQGMTPAVLYGGNEAPQNLTVERKVIAKQVEMGHFLSTIYMLNIAGKKIRVIPRDIQLDVVRDFPTHVDFMRISASSRIDVDVTVHFINEQDSPGIKRGGVLNIVQHQIELNCPADAIPEAIEVDLTGLDIGDAIHISSVKLPANLKPVIERDFTIATIAGSSAMKPEDEDAGGEVAASEDEESSS
jgi:large subunit ribosomal protein L25